MKAETQGKLMVAMVISLLAFGFGTGTILVTGHYQDKNSSTTLNVTKQGDFPYITNNRNYINNTPSSSSTSGQSYNGNNPSNSRNNTNSSSNT